MNFTLKVASGVVAFALVACGSHGVTNVPATSFADSNASFRACSGSRAGQAQCDVLVGNEGAQPNSSVVGLTAADLEDAYKLPSTSKGKGASVFIVDAYDNPNVASDLAQYRSTMGLPAATFNKYNQNGEKSGYPQGSQGWGVEIDLDTQMVSASCPNCAINLIEANSSQWSDIEAAEAEAVTLGATIISNSFSGTGASESYFDTKGVEYLASAGDGGYGGGLLQPATFDSVVAVGATNLVKAKNKRGWKESLWSGSGGGCSATQETKPPWQHDKICKYRLGNDVSAAGGTEIAEYDTYGFNGWIEVGGSSASTPLLAGVFALAGNASKQDGGRTFWLPAHHRFLYVVGKRFTEPGGWGSPDGIGAF